MNSSPNLKINFGGMTAHTCKVCGRPFSDYKLRAPVCRDINCQITWLQKKLEKKTKKVKPERIEKLPKGWPL